MKDLTLGRLTLLGQSGSELTGSVLSVSRKLAMDPVLEPDSMTMNIAFTAAFPEMFITQPSSTSSRLEL